MSDLGREIASTVRRDWSDIRAESVWSGVGPRRRRRIVMRAGLACTAVAVLGAFVMLRREHPPSPYAQTKHAEPPRAEVQVPATDVAVTPTTQPAPAAPPIEVTRVDLARGTRRFDVRGQRYEIQSGHFTIEAFNAAFACSRGVHATRVEVYRGTVLVHDGAKTRELAAGETLEMRVTAPSAPTRDPVTELLHSADVMRLARQPAEAIGPLRRIIDEHAGDSRAPLAAFTLGRVLLDDLDRPRDAAGAFAQVIRFAPSGELAEDALARQIEALARAGDAEAARVLAKDYVRKFPRGRRVHAVRTAGGLP